MTTPLFREDAYAKTARSEVTGVSEGGIVLAQSLFYPTGGGQPADFGRLVWSGGTCDIIDCRKGCDDDILLVPAEGEKFPPVGAEVEQHLDWDRRFGHMRVHTALHLLNALIARDLEVTMQWITDAELAANPGLVKTMSVQPPTGAGHVRLVRIGDGDEQVDLQPCGGTHVARTSEIGRIRLGKVENKGRGNRRVNLHLDG